MLDMYRRTQERLKIEKDRRMYYQDIVYKVANLIDGELDGTTISGSVDNPSQDVTSRLQQLIDLKNNV